MESTKLTMDTPVHSPIGELAAWLAGVIVTALTAIGVVGGWVWKLSSKLAALEESQRQSLDHMQRLDDKYDTINEAVIRTDENVQFIKDILQQPSHLTQHRRHPDRSE